ncbi:hypothetical protein L1889_04480 [Paenalcaligenes niemegkensis]|uniref:hypothetical protein n=1 Tax=Paenalcaligenes niemegkensis TaxID=2895469 RepID=UPI001EE99360|nr:hypothetical protein [Paenalcaligenes niemegkensis]MCQ9616050.1 hypothetical protein [Paenalcaligenes niemegkensis]
MAVWKIIFCLTVISFLFRSVIPAGYMPDGSGGRHGKLAITLCSIEGGSRLLPLDLSPQSGGPLSSDKHTSAADCSFGLGLSQAVVPFHNELVLPGTLSRHSLQLLVRNYALPPLPAQGPPLGSRAPPSSLD